MKGLNWDQVRAAAGVAVIACRRCAQYRQRLEDQKEATASADRQTDAVLEIVVQVAREALRNPSRRAELLMLLIQTAEEAIERRAG